MAGGSASADRTSGGSTSTERLEWVDGAKAIGIVAVAMGHVWWSGPIHDMAYRFHMPLFFLISGYLFTARPMGRFIRQLVPIVIVPYVAFLLLIWGFDIGIEGWRGHRPFLGGWDDSLWKLFYGGTALRGPFTVFWFPLCLMFARIGYNTVCSFAPDPLSGKAIIVALILLALGYGVPVLSQSSPWGLISVPMAMFLIWAGHAWRGLALPGWWAFAAGICAVPVMLLGPIINMKIGDYGWPLVSMAAAIGISFALFQLGYLAALVGALGRGSLVIMYLHVPVIHYVGAGVGRPFLLMLSLALPMAAWWVFGQFKTTSRLFLGTEKR